MLKFFFRHYGCRNFSQSRLLRSAEKGKDEIKPTETPKSSRPPGVSMDFVPSEFDKTILVLSGRYKSKASIPDRITFDTMDNARSRFRIRGANVLMVATLCLCGYYVWKGKMKAKRGETINQMYRDRSEAIKASQS